MLKTLSRCFTAVARALPLLPPCGLLLAVPSAALVRRLSTPSAHDAETRISQLQSETREHLQSQDFASALASALACLEATDSHFGRRHAASACALNNVGQVHRQLGQLADALPFLEDAVEVYTQVCGREHASTGQALSNLGLLHAALAQRASGVARLESVEAAHSLLQQALACKRAAFGAGHVQVGVALYQLATAARLQKRYSVAEGLLGEALALLRAAEAPSGGLATATALNNLGLLCKERGLFEQAAGHYREALQLRLARLGQRHPDTLTAMHNLAECIRAGGDEEGAQSLQRDILKIMQVDK
jgi:tetratricopeptide (TPR) repeat protein